MKVLATGIDIVEVKRIKNIYFRFGNRFLNKVLTLEETSRLEGKSKSFYQSLAGRLAAKEAVYKALNSYDSRIKPKWSQITVYNQDNGSPAVSLNVTLEAGIIIVVSLSHTNDYAVANALLIKE